MARIQVDFEEVMRFGDLHGDIGRDLEARRSAFALDGRRFDQIVDAFQLTRHTGNEHFAGQTFAFALQDASDRTHRVSSSLLKTSSRIFQHANPRVDDSFDWGGLIWEPVAGPVGVLLEWSGGKLAGVITVMGSRGNLSTPYLGFLGPTFSLAAGMLSVVAGATQMHYANDVFDYIAGGLKLVSGGIGMGVGGLGIAFALVGPATAAAFLLSPAVIAVGVVGLAAAGIAVAVDEREALGSAIGSILGFGPSDAEATGTRPISSGLIPLGPMPKPTIVTTFPSTGSESVSVRPSAGGHVPLQGSSNVLLLGPPVAPIRPPTPTATTRTGPEAGLPSGKLGGSDRTATEVQAAYDANGGIQGANRYQCVSWAWFRMRELGYLKDPISVGNGGAMAARLGGSQGTTPGLGAVVSYPGHVMIAEEITIGADGSMRVRVSEMNTDRNTDVARPDEYRSDRVLVRRPDGTWYDEKYRTTRTLTVWNPPYGR